MESRRSRCMLGEWLGPHWPCDPRDPGLQCQVLKTGREQNQAGLEGGWICGTVPHQLCLSRGTETQVP